MIEFSAQPATPLLPALPGTGGMVRENPEDTPENGAFAAEFGTMLAAAREAAGNVRALPLLPRPAAGGKPGGNGTGKTLPDGPPPATATGEPPETSETEPPAAPETATALPATVLSAMALPATVIVLLPFITAAAPSAQPAQAGAAPSVPTPTAPAPSASALPPPVAAPVGHTPEPPPLPRLVLPGRAVVLPPVAVEQMAQPTPARPQRLARSDAAARTGSAVPATAPTAETPALFPAEAVMPAQTLMPAAGAPLTPASAPAVSAAPARAPAPHDFAALVDRLAAARDQAMAAQAPQTLHAAVRHAEFGSVTLRFETGAEGLAVALSSPDPDFARAVQAAAPAQNAQNQNAQNQAFTTSEHGTRPDGQSQQSGTPAERQPPRTNAAPGTARAASAPTGDNAPPARPGSGIFA